MKSQIATSRFQGGTRFLPMVFTEHGVLMLSSVLNSKTAIQVNIQIMRIFIKLREALIENKELMLKIEIIEKKLLKQDNVNTKHENELRVIFNALKKLLTPIQSERTKIGYKK